jgi:hypothetical protein
LKRLYDDNQASALLIDTSGTFQPERAYQMLAKMAASAGVISSTPPGQRDLAIEAVLQRLHITRRSEIAGVAAALVEGAEECRKMVRGPVALDSDR